MYIRGSHPRPRACVPAPGSHPSPRAPQSDRQISRLQYFDRFVNLEVLWLNDNELAKIDNLDNQIRMRALCVAAAVRAVVHSSTRHY